MIAIEDVAYVRVTARDLAGQEKFLLDFEMHTVEWQNQSLYMRGAGPQPVVHITELAREGFVPGLGLIAASLEDLKSVAQTTGAKIEPNHEPGGGQVIRLTDPAGYRVDVIHREPVAPLPCRDPLSLNWGGRTKYARFNTKVRIPESPSTVLRLGHVVMKVPGVKEVFGWYAELFGLRVSERVYMDDPTMPIALFARCGLGQRYTDHHSIAFMQIPGRGFDHSAFEVLDWDDIMLGHAQLAKSGHKHSYGVGRHVAGSMIFDYWRDSGNNKIEHWVDGDQVNDDYEGTNLPMSAVEMASWGPDVTAEFVL
jgi:catechol 2,3-dioxygenase-like lactoylglutathione lyase family enzyme